MQAIPLISLLALFLPLGLGLAALAAGRRHGRTMGYISTAGMALTAALGLYVAFQYWQVDYRLPQHAFANWVALSDSIQLVLGVYVDRVAATMLGLVPLVALAVYGFSLGYMRQEADQHRYWGYLGLFVFAMLGIVLADNLLLLFIFWELVGFASYLLIGFWHGGERPARGAQKAFIVNRIGDAGMLVGILILLAHFTTTDLETLRQLMQGSGLNAEGLWVSELQIPGGEARVHQLPAGWLTGAGLCLFLGVVAKSAQVPLQTWLPDAMAGPTPVSALLHAATMVAAGVYLLSRVFSLFTMEALSVMAVVGAVTALLAALAALVQTDLKRLLAYSTLSQLGYMVMGMGVWAYSDALFHLITHACFKAGLFLGAGAIIHALHEWAHRNGQAFDAQDLRLMGGLGRRLPWVSVCWAGATLALMGVPLFSGFLSKEGLLLGSFAWAEAMNSSWAWGVPLLALATVALTAFYGTRMLLLALAGTPRLPQPAGAAEADPVLPRPGWLLRMPLVGLALLSLGVVFGPDPFTAASSWLGQGLVRQQTAVPFQDLAVNYFAFDQALQEAHHSAYVLHPALTWHRLLPFLNLLLIGAGAGLAWRQYRLGALVRFHVKRAEGLHRWLLQGLGFDAFYDRAVVRPALAISAACAWADRRLIDRAVLGLAQAVGEAELLGRDRSLARQADRLDRHVIDAGITAAADALLALGRWLRGLQSGRLQTYLVWAILLLVGLVLFLAVV